MDSSKPPRTPDDLSQSPSIPYKLERASAVKTPWKPCPGLNSFTAAPKPPPSPRRKPIVQSQTLPSSPQIYCYHFSHQNSSPRPGNASVPLSPTSRPCASSPKASEAAGIDTFDHGSVSNREIYFGIDEEEQEQEQEEEEEQAVMESDNAATATSIQHETTPPPTIAEPALTNTIAISASSSPATTLDSSSSVAYTSPGIVQCDDYIHVICPESTWKKVHCKKKNQRQGGYRYMQYTHWQDDGGGDDGNGWKSLHQWIAEVKLGLGIDIVTPLVPERVWEMNDKFFIYFIPLFFFIYSKTRR